jgi:hypothetical protein
MWRVVVFLVAAAQFASGQGASRGAPADSALRALRDSVIASERRFLAKWDTAWMRSEHERHQFSMSDDAATLDGSRHQNYHCHPEFRSARSATIQGRLIQSTHGWFSVCPSFDIGDIRIPLNERIDLDGVLTDTLRAAVRVARRALIATLDTVNGLLPGDDFLAGQRIRMLVDQWEFDSALVAARGCRATRWWCAALAGYVHASRGEVSPADSAFTAAFAAMPREERCAWNDYRLVIDFDSRDKYGAASCDKRDALNERLWWLADPLFIEPGNERKVEQDVRTTLLALRTALDRDERFSWDPKIGNDARRAMIERYGWPSYAFWGGPLQDRSHTGYLWSNHSPPNEPYTTYEYFGSRVHTIPLWAAITDPFHSMPTDWNLTKDAARDSAPRRERAMPPSELFTARVGAPPLQPPEYWWPIEHFEPRRPLVQLPSGQQALLRREKGALLAVATELNAETTRHRAGDTIPGIALVTSDGPRSLQRVAEARGVVGGPLEIDGLVGSSPVVVGVEYDAGGRRGSAAGRLRFGVTPPLPLSAMTTGGVAISDPVILRAPASPDEAIPNDPVSALKRMATSHFVNKPGRFGVYWETYGFRPSDTVEVAVWVERSTAQGIVRRLGIVMGMATDLNTPIAISWKEPESSHRAHVFSEGNVTVVGRSVVIDVSNLPAGEYRLEVAVRRAGQDAAVGRTTFVVR